MAVAGRGKNALETQYNLGVRTGAVLILVLSLSACKSGTQNREAVRQGIIDHLAKKGIATKAMDISLTSVDIKGSQADATAAMSVKGSTTGPAMSFKYHLEQQGGQWVVINSADAGGSPHGAVATPGGAPPHGSMEPAPGGENPHAAGGGAKMPSPEDLPPSGKKK